MGTDIRRESPVPPSECVWISRCAVLNLVVLGLMLSQTGCWCVRPRLYHEPDGYSRSYQDAIWAEKAARAPSTAGMIYPPGLTAEDPQALPMSLGPVIEHRGDYGALTYEGYEERPALQPRGYRAWHPPPLLPGAPPTQLGPGESAPSFGPGDVSPTFVPPGY